MGILEGKAVMITGAASGIGRATAIEAASEGAKLMLCDLDAEKGGAVAAEIGEAAVEAAVQATVSELGRIDGAFNCAGILGVVGNIGELPLDGWKQLIEVDLNGVFLCTKHQVNAMAAQGSGSILNMASAAGLIGWPGASGFGPAKHSG